MKKKRAIDPTRVAEREVLDAVIRAVTEHAVFGTEQSYLDKEVRRVGAAYLRTLFRARGRIRSARRKAVSR